MINAFVDVFLTLVSVYFGLGIVFGTMFLIALWILEQPDLSGRMPNDTKLLVDDFYVNMEMLGWAPITFAIVIAVMWLPIKLGWKVF